MKKMISILTLCLVTGLSMTSPVAASTNQPSTQTSENVNIVQSGLSNLYLCLNQNALLYNGVYLNASCLKLQPKCNSTLVNSNISQQISGYNAFCQNRAQQASTANTDATTATKASQSTLATQSAQTTPSTQATASPTTGTKAAASPQSTTCPQSSKQTVTYSTTQSTNCPKTTQSSTQTTTSAATPVNGTSNTTSSSSFSEFQKKVIALVNNERANAGLNALSENNELNNVATLKSEDMVKLNYFSHTSPTYGSPFEMLTQFNIKYTAAGENIAYGQPTPEEVMNGWMNSPGHRANILNKNFTQIGVGIAQKANGQYVWTQEFTRP
ncbi:CAP domain-containing protein [[Clostridium] fimetarium]|uniref:Uncharacterized protein, YkwD family n=1 Tax=[Clostridium] fimetarium TaxID=99656 RepID=A0A1I0MVC7_9FIRM|nr:CAP domain-containing protein [[Clostridium] fimetarium]SEV92733.1 uncharacterized protein, YkwD family [[Clostridium] fimetarium]